MARPHRLRQPSATLDDWRCENCGYTTPCHIFLGPRSGDGYGRVTIEGRRRRAHIAAWERAYGPLPTGHHIHHCCETKLCINLQHLEALPAGAHRRRHPPNYGNARLSPQLAAEIRLRLLAGERPLVLLRDYGISRSHLWTISRGKCWGRVTTLPPDARHYPKHGLTAEQIEELRLLHAAGLSYRALSRLFSVSPPTIRRLLYHRT